MTNQKQKGYALLFAIIITSIISVIVAGLSNLAYKQLILSSMVKDSQSAFYMADTASECALYFDLKVRTSAINGQTWLCGLDNKGDNFSLTYTITDPGSGSYELNPPASMDSSPKPCFEISVTKDLTDPGNPATETKARGYNMCNKSNIRTVQREIEVNY